jgi:hypothetical protein
MTSKKSNIYYTSKIPYRNPSFMILDVYEISYLINKVSQYAFLQRHFWLQAYRREFERTRAMFYNAIIFGRRKCAAHFHDLTTYPTMCVIVVKVHVANLYDCLLNYSTLKVSRCHAH